MRVPGIIVARTDAEAANLIDSRADERDQPFLLGATNLKVPSYKSCFLAMVRRFYELGIKELNGHLLYALADGEYAAADAWLERQGIMGAISDAVNAWQKNEKASVDELFDEVESRFVDCLGGRRRPDDLRRGRGRSPRIRPERGRPDRHERRRVARLRRARVAVRRAAKAKELGVDAAVGLRARQDPGGLLPDPRRHPYAIAKSLAARPSPTSSGWRPRPPTSPTPGSSPTRSTPSSPTRCWPTTCRRRSTGTPPA